MGAAVKDKMPPNVHKLDSYAAMAAVRTTTQKDMGRGATAGWVHDRSSPYRR